MPENIGSSRCKALARALSAELSHRADHVEEDAVVVVAQVRQVFREVGEVVSDAHLEVLPEVAVDREQAADAALVLVRQVEDAALDRALPVLEEAVVDAQDP